MAVKSEIIVSQETPLQPVVRELIGELNAALLALTPAEHCYHMSVDEMADDATTVFVARKSGDALAVGALKRHPGNIGEVKRMYTRPAARGMGTGRKILNAVETLARNEGLEQLVLETGHDYTAAQKLYESEGFLSTGPVLDYIAGPFTAFYQKRLLPDDKSIT